MSTWAPDLLRIAYYTDDELLEAFARNALVGRFANYPSYYLNEYSTYQQQENFPYIGPDTTQIYYHHIPVMISMLQDFLISQAYSWSDAKVDFRPAEVRAITTTAPATMALHPEKSLTKKTCGSG